METDVEIIVGLITEARAQQELAKTATKEQLALIDAALTKGLAAQAENAAIVNALIEKAADVVEELKMATSEIAPAAASAAAKIVDKKVTDGLTGASAVIVAAATVALKPLEEQLDRRAAVANRATDALNTMAKWFSYQTIGWVATTLGVIFVVCGFLGWETLEWQRAEVAKLTQQTADLQNKISAMSRTSKEMEDLGLNIKLTACNDKNDASRVCVVLSSATVSFTVPANPGVIYYIVGGS